MNLEERFQKFINTDIDNTTSSNRLTLVLKFKDELKELLKNVKEGTYIYYVIINYFNSRIALFIYENYLKTLSLSDLERYWKLEDFNIINNENKRNIKLYIHRARSGNKLLLNK